MAIQNSSTIRQVNFGTWGLSQTLKKQVSYDLKWYHSWANHYYNQGGVKTLLAAMEIVPILILSCPLLNVITSVALHVLYKGREQSSFEGAFQAGNATGAYLMVEEGAKESETDSIGRTLLDQFAEKASQKNLTKQDLRICEKLLWEGYKGDFAQESYAHLLDAALLSENHDLAVLLLKKEVKSFSDWKQVLPEVTRSVLPRWAKRRIPLVNSKPLGTNIHRTALHQLYPKTYVDQPIVNEMVKRLSHSHCPVLLCDDPMQGKGYVEALSKHMLADKVPDSLQCKRLIHLDLSPLKGMFDFEIKKHLSKYEAALRRNPDLVIYVDDFSLLEKGEFKDLDPSSRMNQAMKEWVATGRVIFSMQRAIYSQNFSQTPLLSPIEVPPIEEKEAAIVLKRNHTTLEKEHGVSFSPSAFQAAILMMRYINNCSFITTPYKLLEQAADLLKAQEDKGSIKRQTLQKKERELLLELEDLSTKNGRVTEKRIHQLQAQIEKIQKEIQEIQEQEIKELEWKKEYQILKDEEAYLLSIEENYDVQSVLKKVKEKLQELEKKETLIKFRVDRELVAAAVANEADLPVDQLQGDDVKKFQNFDATLRKSVIGQEEAVRKTANAVIRSRAGFKDESRPIGTFLYAGPTGTGKTELAKALAHELFGDEKKLTRLDMSEFSDEHSKSGLIGSPPGFKGSREGGKLTNSLRETPYQVVLIDEVEKAHPKVLSLFLQAFDDGRLTAGNGETVDCSKALFVMTTNLGSRELVRNQKALLTKRDPTSIIKQAVLNSAHFPPELYNRVQMIPFLPLTDDNVLVNITRKLLSQVQGQIEKRHGIELTYTEKAMKALTAKGKDPAFGARPLRDFITENILTELAEMKIGGKIVEGDTIHLDYKWGEFTFETKRPSHSRG